jgi:hypothetical protein
MKKFMFVWLMTAAIACKKESTVTPTPTPTDVISAVTTTLSGANHTPAVNTTATGTVTGTYNKTKKTLSIVINYSGMSPNFVHIHKGFQGAAQGGLAFDIGPAPSPINAATITLTAQQETELLSGLYYVNLHSAKAPDGEIRGNLVVK